LNHSQEKLNEDAFMNVRLLVCAIAAVAICGCTPRQVEVRTAPAQQSGVAVQVKNDVNQAVNVYITLNGTDTFLRQVGANSSATIPVQGFASGSTVGLKAVTVDGQHTYSRSNVVLSGTYVFPLP
jgi:hypothetical protein